MTDNRNQPDAVTKTVAPLDMDAPIYRPSAAFEEPILVPGQTSLAKLTIGELLEAPATRHIILADPVIAAFAESAMAIQHSYNFTVYDLAVQDPKLSQETIAEMDRQFRLLTPVQLPVV